MRSVLIRGLAGLVVVAGAAVSLVTPASAGQVTNVSFSASTTQGDATDAWTVSFTPATSLAANDTVTIFFPSAFAVASAPPLTFSSSLSACSTSTASASVDTSGTNEEQVVVTLAGSSCSLSAGTAGTIGFNVTNPPAPQQYALTDFEIYTSVDNVFAAASIAPTSITGSSSPVTVNTFSPVSGELYGNEVATWEFAFTPVHQLAAGDAVTLTFPSTVTLPSSPTATTISSSFGATCSIGVTKASAGELLATLGPNCSLAASTLGSFEIGSIQNPPYGDSGFTFNYAISTTEDTVAANPSQVPAFAPSGTEPPDNDTITVSGFGPTNSTAGAATTWKLTFTTSTNGALFAGDEILFAIPASVSITSSSGESAVLAGGFSGTCSGARIVEMTPVASPPSYEVTIPTGCTLADSTSGSVSFAATNPPAGNYPGSDFVTGTTEDTIGPVMPSVDILGVAGFSVSTTDHTSGTSTISYGDVVTVTLADATDAPAPTGTVSIGYTTDGTTFDFPSGCTGLTLSAGAAQCAISTLPASSTLHFVYTYSGDGSYAQISTATEVGASVTVAPAPLTVSANSNVIVEGSPYTPSPTVLNPVSGGTASITSVVLTFAGEFGTTYGPSTVPPTLPGTYSVTPSAATLTVAPGTLSDYSVTYVPGTLTIIRPTVGSGSSGASGSTAPQVTLSVALSSAQVSVGNSLDLSSEGGSGTGAVTFSIVGGTAPGCAINGTTLTSSGPGTCVVEATKSGDATFAEATSAPVTVTFVVAKVVIHRPVVTPHPVSVTFAPGSSSLTPTARRVLVALVRRLHPGATVTLTATGDPRALAIARARAVEAFLTHYRHLHVSVVAVLSAAARVRVVTVHE